MRSSDWVCFAYFGFLVVACWLPPLATRARLTIIGVAAGVAAAMVRYSAALPGVIHDWAPLLYISIGYYLTGLLFVAPSSRLETWLLDGDRRLFGDPTIRFARWPPALTAYLDIVYMGCFLLLPGGLVVLLAGGHAHEANRYWTVVAIADLGAFAPLAVFQTRPPWQIEPAATVSAAGTQRLAGLMVRHATTGANTFPSGHVSVSLAIALVVFGSMPLAGLVLLALSLSIAVACVVGRYHYAIDVVAGAAWGLLAWILVILSGV